MAAGMAGFGSSSAASNGAWDGYELLLRLRIAVGQRSAAAASSTVAAMAGHAGVGADVLRIAAELCTAAPDGYVCVHVCVCMCACACVCTCAHVVACVHCSTHIC